MENLLDGWGITLATFSPLVGAAVMMLIPREREDRHKMVALVTSLWVAFVGVMPQPSSRFSISASPRR